MAAIAFATWTRALSTDDAVRIIDDYLHRFEEALEEGRVRFDNAGDFNTMLRLKEFVQGRADSRQEIHGLLTLEEIQARHRRLRDELDALDPGLSGAVVASEDAGGNGSKGGASFGQSGEAVH